MNRLRQKVFARTSRHDDDYGRGKRDGLQESLELIVVIESELTSPPVMGQEDDDE